MTQPMEHNYIVKMQAMQARGELPLGIGAHLITVWHDGTCNIYQQSLCDCSPDIEVSCSMPASSEN